MLTVHSTSVHWSTTVLKCNVKPGGREERGLAEAEQW